MDVCGYSLADLLEKCGGTFGLRTVLRVGIQMVDLLQSVHSKNVIHRDVKPNNFLIGTGKNKDRIYVVDFGLAKKFRDSAGKHIPCSKNRGLTGTVRYTSLNVHRGIEPARRDDLTSVGYVLIYFLSGRLPWQGINVKSKKTKQRRMGRVKQQTSHAELCAGFPNEFVKYLEYCENLGYEEDPDYAYLRGLLLSALQAHDARHVPAPFDWELPAQQLTKIERPKAVEVVEPKPESVKQPELDDKEKNTEVCNPGGVFFLEAVERFLWKDFQGFGSEETSEDYESYVYDSEECDHEEIVEQSPGNEGLTVGHSKT